MEASALTENVGHRASVYVEQFSLTHGLRCGDALIAANAIEYDQTLVSGNRKHFACIPDLKFKAFRPCPPGAHDSLLSHIALQID